MYLLVEYSHLISYCNLLNFVAKELIIITHIQVHRRSASTRFGVEMIYLVILFELVYRNFYQKSLDANIFDKKLSIADCSKYF